MIHTTGDSHCGEFKSIPGIAIHGVGPVTLKRVGYLEDDLLPNHAKLCRLTPADTLILCFGEIDCRCYVYPQAIRPNIDLRAVLTDWVERYLTRAVTLDLNGARPVIMAVAPPTTFARAYNATFPVAGTDEDRVRYTRLMNECLHESCARRSVPLIDATDYYADANGMLQIAKADANVHIEDATGLLAELRRLGLYP